MELVLKGLNYRAAVEKKLQQHLARINTYTLQQTGKPMESQEKEINKEGVQWCR